MLANANPTHAVTGRAEFAKIFARIARWQTDLDMKIWVKCHGRTSLKWDNNSSDHQADNWPQKRCKNAMNTGWMAMCPFAMAVRRRRGENKCF